MAAQGGVCHIIGDTHCTYILDISDNVTCVVSHLKSFLRTLGDLTCGPG